jgi:hypothetical protein
MVQFRSMKDLHNCIKIDNTRPFPSQKETKSVKMWRKSPKNLAFENYFNYNLGSKKRWWAFCPVANKFF